MGFSRITEGTLDREEHPKYNVTIVAYNEVRRVGFLCTVVGTLGLEGHTKYNVTIVAYSQVRKGWTFQPAKPACDVNDNKTAGCI